MTERVRPVSPSLLKRFVAKMYFYIVILIVIVISLSFFRTLANMKKVEQQIAEKEQGVVKKREEQEELKRKLEFSKSSEFMEKQLRDKLGLVRENEIVVVLPPPEVLRQFAPRHEPEIEVTPEPNWKKWKNLLNF